MAFTDTLEWPECNSDKATVGSVVCTVCTSGEPYKQCVLCETGFIMILAIFILIQLMHSATMINA